MDHAGREGAEAPRSSGTVLRDWLLIGLTLAAGCVDGISYLGLGRVFTANMTGNAVLLGLAIGQAEGIRVAHVGVALLGFALGVVLGARLGARAASASSGLPASRWRWESNAPCSSDSPWLGGPLVPRPRAPGCPG